MRGPVVGLGAEDEPQVIGLARGCRAWRIGRGCPVDPAIDFTAIASRLAAGHYRGVLVDGRLLAAAAVSPEPPPYWDGPAGYLSGLVTAAPGQGLAVPLWDDWLDDLPVLRLDCYRNLERYYLARGFDVVGEVRYPFGSTGVLMERDRRAATIPTFDEGTM